MKLRLLSALLITTLLAGCPGDGKKPTKAKGDKFTTQKPPMPTKDQSNDVTFQSFVGRLRIAVEKRDLPTLSQVMVDDFGYRWDAAPEGENVFTYWDKNNLWGELATLVHKNWVPYDGFMVVPPQLALDPQYGGYRAGVRMVNGSWRFMYFVPPPPMESGPTVEQ